MKLEDWNNNVRYGNLLYKLERKRRIICCWAGKLDRDGK